MSQEDVVMVTTSVITKDYSVYKCKHWVPEDQAATQSWVVDSGKLKIRQDDKCDDTDGAISKRKIGEALEDELLSR